MDRKISLFVGLAVLAIFVFFFWLYRGNKPIYEWSDSRSSAAYQETNPEPYGTQIFRRLLGTYFPGKKTTDIQKSLVSELPLQADKPSNYVFVGEAMFLDSLDTRHLLAFVEKGNTAFISSKTIPYDLFNYLYIEECEEAFWDDYAGFWDSSAVQMRLSSPQLGQKDAVSLHFSVQNKVVPYHWHYIENPYFCEAGGLSALGFLNDSLINFAEFRHGNGRFLLHTTPLAFSNYWLLRPEGQRYASAVLARLSEGDIYWDAFSRQPEAIGRQRNQQRGGSRQLPEKHELTYILAQRSLAWAWYLLVALGVAWMLFRAKRRHRIIPVLPKNENSSLEFIRTIAHLHFRERDYQRLCIQKMKLFLAHLRERYGVQVQLAANTQAIGLDTAFFQRIARMSELPESAVRDIFAQYDAIARYQPTETMMTDFHLAVESFLKKAK